MNWAKIIIGDSRKMIEVKESSVDLIITSPPYWHIKDYGVKGQIGYGQSLHEYLKDLYRIWKECYRVLKPGRRLCINIGDQFARSIIYGQYKIIPLHAEVISQCEDIGFDYMGSIIWQKKTTMNTTGGANVMGSYPYPPNGMIEIDYEFILIFRKAGKTEKVSQEIKEKSRLTKEEWKEYFYGHWNFGGAKQIQHEAMFPEELPKRLIRMYSFVGDVVLDPFLGSGTTIKSALNLNRNAIGYEINEKFLDIIKEKLGIKQSMLKFSENIQIIKREIPVEVEEISYIPRIKPAEPKLDQKKFNFNGDKLYKVVDVIDTYTIKLNTGLIIKLLGVEVIKKQQVLEYLNDRVKGKDVYLKFDKDSVLNENTVWAYVYLKNKIFVNAYLIKSGLAVADKTKEYRYKTKFIELEKEVKDGKGMDFEYGNK
ncbi:DNA methylase N-4 [Caldimicrobium thiodismutans]|uniref:Methyltransferase n=2 Tax=Caldimicrobium thiodismutans TaxID=1653476 RepID=A0A0U5B6Z9_9BACT|nr:DNA methyltransferase [Caldimicrobium thiodismutans]BAU23856.1 DNA methylase N-4 [Caldimicrobium thiodismutans]